MTGFAKRQLVIGDGRQPVHKYKLCNKCEEMRPPEGGVQMSPSKWLCAVCWTRRITTKNLLDSGEKKREE